MNNKSKLSDGTIKTYQVYRCKIFVKEEQKIYTEKNKDKILKNKKEYHANNKEKHAENTKLYRKENDAEIKKSKKEYYATNGKEIRANNLIKKQTIEGTLTNLVNKRREYNKKHGQTCDVDVAYLKLLIENQNSKCIYCKHELKIMFKSNELSQISVDRIDSSKLYSKDNIYVCCLFCNLAKNDMDESLYKKFIGVLCGEKHEFEHTEQKDIISRITNACKNGDRAKNFNLEETITIDQVRELLVKQNNKCAISGIQLNLAKERSHPCKISVDRINNSLGHTLENCQIVSLAIQRGKLDKNNDDTIKYVKEIMES
jgi:hypothetical protein